MPAVSETQQRFMGMVHAYQKGELDMSNISASGKKKIRKAANEMSMKQTKDFAEIKHKGLPEKKAMWQNSFKDEIKKAASKKSVLTWPETALLTVAGSAALGKLLFDHTNSNVIKVHEEIVRANKKLDKLQKQAFRLPVAIESLSPTYANRIVNMASKSKHVGTIGKDLAALKEQLSLGEMARALGGTKEMKHRIAAHALAKNIDATLRNLK